MSVKKQLARIPEFIEFEHYPEQELHSFIEIQNLTEQIISYKIKTTAPDQYLVKPMEGQIYKKQKAKVVFKRKKLSIQNFEAIQNGTKPFKERFMFIISCKSKNAIGIEKLQETSHIMNVKFTTSRKPYQQAVTSPVKKSKKTKTPEQIRQQNELMALIKSEKQKLEVLKRQRSAQEDRLQNMQSLVNSPGQLGENMRGTSLPSNHLNEQNLICLLIMFLLLGLWL